MANLQADASLSVAATGLSPGLPYTLSFQIDSAAQDLNSIGKNIGNVWYSDTSLAASTSLTAEFTRNQFSDSSLSATVGLTAAVTLNKFLDASLVTTASPVDAVNFSPALPDANQAITVPGMEQSTVTFDAVGTGADSGAGQVTSLSWTHTATAGADVFAFVLRGGYNITVTHDGVAMTYVGAISLNNSEGNGTLYVFRRANVPAGTKTIAVSFGGSTYCSANSVSYLNVGSVTTSAAYGGSTGLVASQTITGATKSIVVNATGQFCGGVDTFVSSSGGTQRVQRLASSNYMNLVVQDTNSTGSTAFSSTVTATATAWGSMGLVLSPAPASTAKVKAVELLSTVSTGAQPNAYSINWNHTIEPNTDMLVVAWGGLSTQFYTSVTVNGLTMSRAPLDWVWVNNGYVGWINVHYYINPPSGTQNIVISGGGTGAYMSATSLTFRNAKAFGTAALGTGGVISGAGPNDFLLNIVSGWNNGQAGFTGYTGTLIFGDLTTTGEAAIFGYARGSSATFSVANLLANYGGWGNAVLPIKPLTDHVANASLAVTATPTQPTTTFNWKPNTSLGITANITATASVNAVNYDSTGAGASANGGTLTWSHTLSANANCVIVGMTTNTNSYNMPTVKIGSTYLKCLGISYYDVPGNRYGMLWGMMNPPTGTQTFTVTGQVNYTSANSVAYQNVSGFSIPSYNKGAGTSLSLSMAGVDAGMIVQVLSSNAPSQITNYNRTTRYNIRDSNTYALVIGDGPGGVGATYTATNPDSSAWGTIGVSLLPRSATPTGTQYDGMGIGYAQTGGSSITFSHVATAGSYVILDMAIDRNITLSNVLYAGQAMTLLGSARFTGQSGNAGMYRYGIANAPGGLSTVTATTSATTYFAANTTGYINVGYMSAPQTASGNGSAPSQAVTLSESDQIAIESIGVYANTLGTLTGDNNLLAFSWANMSLVINDATASTTFTTGNTGVNWGAIYTILSPVDTSLAATATITADADIRQGIWQVDSTTVASTATLTATATRNIFADSPQVITTTLTNTGTRNAIVDSLQAITVGEIGQDVVAFDSVGVGATGSGTPKTITWNHTISPSANYVIMAVSTLINGTNNYSIYTALLGSTPMTYLGGTDNYDTSPGPYAIYFWGMANPPTGTQTFSVGTSSLATYLAANTVAYRNVGEVSPIYTKAGAAGTSFSHGSINSETGEIVVQAFAQGQNILIGSYNQTSRYNVSGAANVNAALLIGEAAGGSALTFTATSSASDFYGSVAIALIPAPSSTRNANVDSSQALTVTETQTGLRNAIVNSATQAITAAPSGLPNAGYKVSAPQAITASPSTAGSYGAVGNTSLALTETASSSGLRVAATDSSLALTAGRIGSDLSPAWAATGPGTAGNAGILSFTDTIPVGTSYTLVWSQMLCASSSPTVSVTIGGVSATLVDSLQIALTGGNNLFLFCFGLANPPTGSQTVSYTTNSNLACPVNTVHYSRVSRANSVAKLGYQSGQPSITLPVNDSRFMYAQAFGYAAAAVGNSYTAYNQSQRYITSAVANVSGPLLIGDAAGTGGSLTFSATRDNTSYSWGTIVVVLATSNPFAAIGTTFDSSQAITVGEPGNVKWALNAAAPLAITVDLPALENESSVISTPLEVTASFTAEITKTRLIEGGTQELTVTPTADMLRNANTDSVAGAIATITSVAQRNAGVDSSSVVIAAQNSIVKWGALFAVSQPIAATTSITATRAARVDALLALAATAEATPHIDHPASSSLVLTVSDSAATFNADFVTAATMLTSASSSVTALRSIYFDAELVITETATSQVKWSLKAQATHVITVDSSGTATRNARVDASLLAALGRDGYMFQTESFDVPLNVIADLTAILNITTTLESPTLDVLADLTGRVVRILFADSDPIDITVEIPQSDFLLSHYAEAVVAVNNTLDGSAVLDAVCNVTLEVSADASVIINQDAIIDTDLQIEAIFVSDMLMDAIIDAYLSANTDLATKTIRGQYIDAEQELVFTVTEETKWNIMMQALLNVPVTTTVDTRFGQATSNFFVFYL